MLPPKSESVVRPADPPFRASGLVPIIPLSNEFTMSTQLDLRQLAVDRSSPETSTRRRRPPIVSRYVLPGSVLFGFVALIAWAARDQFLPSRTVTVVPVVVSRAEVQQSGTPLFQAAGWIEPRPTTVRVPALAAGTVTELSVVEGQSVEAGETIARLVDLDARLELEQAQAELALRQTTLASAEAELMSARSRLEMPVHLEAALAAAESELAQVETELAKLPYLIRAAQAREEYAQQDMEGKQSAGAAVANRLVQQADSAYHAAHADHLELKNRQPRLKRQVETLRRRKVALAKQLELLVDETRELADAQAKVQAAKVQIRQAELAVQAAEIQLDRMVVRAPVAGRVLELISGPGALVMGQSPQSNQDASTVVTLYDPGMLQVRADVRLEDVSHVQPGQPVEIETASVTEPIRGTVLYPTSRANIQKNTLEVKVAIESPPLGIRPEMLVTATFLAPQRPESDSEESDSQQRLLIPRQLVQSEGEVSLVWIAGAEGLARRKSVRLGKAGSEELVEVIDGVTPTDKLISSGRDGLEDGDRISIRTGQN